MTKRRLLVKCGKRKRLFCRLKNAEPSTSFMIPSKSSNQWHNKNLISQPPDKILKII